MLNSNDSQKQKFIWAYNLLSNYLKGQMTELIKLFIRKKRRFLVTKSDYGPKPVLNCLPIYKTMLTYDNIVFKDFNKTIATPIKI